MKRKLTIANFRYLGIIILLLSSSMALGGGEAARHIWRQYGFTA